MLYLSNAPLRLHSWNIIKSANFVTFFSVKLLIYRPFNNPVFSSVLNASPFPIVDKLPGSVVQTKSTRENFKTTTDVCRMQMLQSKLSTTKCY